MVKAVLAVMLLLLAPVAFAAPARVSSGEHEGFTRLVIETEQIVGWAVGRTDDGYEVRLTGLQGGFDLGSVFNRIGRDRIAGLSQDAQIGSLRMNLACSCHIVPFNLNAGTIVLDVRDGPPPANSAFEVRLNIPAAPPIPEPERAAGTGSGLSTGWISRALGQSQVQPMSEGATKTVPTIATLPGPNDVEDQVIGLQADLRSSIQMPPMMDKALVPLRDSLMREISLGAARGVVEMALDQSETRKHAETPGKERDTIGMPARAALGSLPQIRFQGQPSDHPDLAAEGARCPTNDQLAIASWGDDRPVWEQISEARSGLMGEFDHLNPDNLATAIKFYLHIGFGQESLSMIREFGIAGDEARLWSSIAHTLDELTDPDPAFLGFESCDSAAALWALFGPTQLVPEQVNLAAVQRSFSALPARLRQSLGPRLIERLTAIGAKDAIQIVANSIQRLGANDNREITLMQAQMAASVGNYEQADDMLRPLLNDPGPLYAEALAAQIEGNAARGIPIPKATLAQIEAYASERSESPDNLNFARARILAQALSGDFVSAFTEAPEDPDLSADLWRLLAGLGPDDAILQVAAIAPGQIVPREAAAVAADLAQRFLALGLPEQAQIWLAGSQNADRILAAQIAVARHDGLSALAYLKGIDGETAQELRLKATFLTGDDASAARSLLEDGRESEAHAALARARDWEALSREGPAEWLNVALILTAPIRQPELGPLAKGFALAENAFETRKAIDALLVSVPAVENPSW